MATQVKKELVAELVEKIKKAQSVVFVDYQGIKVNEETSLRKQMRENGAEYLVAKNRLFKSCFYASYCFPRILWKYPRWSFHDNNHNTICSFNTNCNGIHW